MAEAAAEEINKIFKGPGRYDMLVCEVLLRWFCYRLQQHGSENIVERLDEMEAVLKKVIEISPKDRRWKRVMAELKHLREYHSDGPTSLTSMITHYIDEPVVLFVFAKYEDVATVIQPRTKQASKKRKRQEKLDKIKKKEEVGEYINEDFKQIKKKFKTDDYELHKPVFIFDVTGQTESAATKIVQTISAATICAFRRVDLMEIADNRGNLLVMTGGRTSKVVYAMVTGATIVNVKWIDAGTDTYRKKKLPAQMIVPREFLVEEYRHAFDYYSEKRTPLAGKKYRLTLSAVLERDEIEKIEKIITILGGEVVRVKTDECITLTIEGVKELYNQLQYPIEEIRVFASQ